MAAVSGETRRGHLFQAWTCKEALVSCAGLGIHTGMAQLQVALDGPGGARLAAAWRQQRELERPCVVPLALGGGHARVPVHEPAAVRRFLLDGVPDPIAGNRAARTSSSFSRSVSAETSLEKSLQVVPIPRLKARHRARQGRTDRGSPSVGLVDSQPRLEPVAPERREDTDPHEEGG